VFGSRDIANRLVSKWRKENRFQLRGFVDASAGNERVASVRGTMFEILGHEILCRGGKFNRRALVPSPGKAAVENCDLGTINSGTFFFNALDKLKPLRAGSLQYARPEAQNFACIDALMLGSMASASASFSSPKVMLFQFTVSHDHKLLLSALEDIDAALSTSATGTLYELYFVVPPDVFAAFTSNRPYQKKKSQAKAKKSSSSKPQVDTEASFTDAQKDLISRIKQYSLQLEILFQEDRESVTSTGSPVASLAAPIMSSGASSSMSSSSATPFGHVAAPTGHSI